QILARHPQLLRVLELLVEEVQRRDQRHHREDADQQARRQRMHQAEQGSEIASERGVDSAKLGQQQDYANRADDGELQQSLDELRQRLRREQALKALEGRDLLELRLQALERDQKAVLDEPGSQRRRDEENYRDSQGGGGAEE